MVNQPQNEYLLIDAYNVINAWPDMFSLDKEPLEDCRDKLLQMISNYQGYKNINVIVVFDAHLVKGSQQKEEIFDNLTIVFTKENETADNFIERFVYKNAGMSLVKVVTSDYLEQTMILRCGGVRVSPREFREELKSVGVNSKRKPSNSIERLNTFVSRVEPELLEKLEKIRRGKV